MKGIQDLSRGRALRELSEYMHGEAETNLSTLEVDIGTWLCSALMKEIVGGGVQMFTFFDRSHNYEQVVASFQTLLDIAGLNKFKPAPGGFTDGNNYIRILTEDSIYSRKYLAPIYECLVASEHPQDIDVTKPFLYVPEAKYIDFPWIIEELLIHLDKPMDVHDLKLYPPEVEPVHNLIHSLLEYAHLEFTEEMKITPQDDLGIIGYEICAIDPDRYGFNLVVMERPEQSDRAKDMIAQFEDYVKRAQSAAPAALTDQTTGM